MQALRLSRMEKLNMTVRRSVLVRVEEFGPFITPPSTRTIFRIEIFQFAESPQLYYPRVYHTDFFRCRVVDDTPKDSDEELFVLNCFAMWDTYEGASIDEVVKKVIEQLQLGLSLDDSPCSGSPM